MVIVTPGTGTGAASPDGIAASKFLLGLLQHFQDTAEMEVKNYKYPKEMNTRG